MSALDPHPRGMWLATAPWPGNLRQAFQGNGSLRPAKPAGGCAHLAFDQAAAEGFAGQLEGLVGRPENIVPQRVSGAGEITLVAALIGESDMDVPAIPNAARENHVTGREHRDVRANRGGILITRQSRLPLIRRDPEGTHAHR